VETDTGVGGDVTLHPTHQDEHARADAGSAPFHADRRRLAPQKPADLECREHLPARAVDVNS
jgi:hypothetical protein